MKGRSYINLLFVVGLFSGCAAAPQYNLRPLASFQGQEARVANSRVAQALAAGASVTNPSIVWQMAAKSETEHQVYMACMRGNGIEP